MSVALLKSQDVLLLCKLVVLGPKAMKQKDLSLALGINQSEVSTGFERLITSNLIHEQTRVPNPFQTIEFLESAVKYFFPAETLEYTVGIPTSIFGGRLAKDFAKTEKTISRVWPSVEGKERGIGLKPIHDSVIEAAKHDEKLYHLLCAVDAMRAFAAGRSKEMASALIRKLILGTESEISE